MYSVRIKKPAEKYLNKASGKKQRYGAFFENTNQRRDTFFGKTNSGEKTKAKGVLLFLEHQRGKEHLPRRKIKHFLPQEPAKKLFCFVFVSFRQNRGTMPTYQRSKIKFESTTVQTESGRCIGMFEIDCSPPPAGAEREFVYAKEAAPMIQQQFMQAGELTGLLAGAAQPGETLDTAILLSDLATQFSFANLAIDEKNLPPIWKNGSLCFKVTVSYMVLYMVWQIKATAAEQFTAGNTTWPKDDTVATFRIMVPHSYTFRRDYQWNPSCCKGNRRIREADIHGPFPAAFYLDIPLPPHWNSKPGWGLSPRIEYEDKDD